MTVKPFVVNPSDELAKKMHSGDMLWQFDDRDGGKVVFAPNDVIAIESSDYERAGLPTKILPVVYIGSVTFWLDIDFDEFVAALQNIRAGL